MKILSAMRLETFYVMHEQASKFTPHEIEVSYVIDGDKMEVIPQIDNEADRNDIL